MEELRKLSGQVESFLKENFEEQVRFLKALVLAESPSLEPQTQHRIFEILTRTFEDLGFEVRLLRGKMSGGRLFARPKVRRRGMPAQLLLGHVDTVWPLGTLAKMPVSISDGKMMGPGVYDMKAGITQILFAFKALQAVDFQPDVTPLVYLSSDEELGSEDSRSNIQLLARRVIRVFVPEPSTGPEGKLKTSRKGVGLFRIEIEGRGAHAGVEPEKGVSAVVELAHLIQSVERLQNPSTGLTLTTGRVEGGTRPNMVPAHASALVDVRARTRAEHEEVEKELKSIQPSLNGASIRVEGGLDRPPMERTPRNQRLWLQARQMGRLLGLELEESESGGGSDGNLTSPFTATLDGLGGVGGGAHATHEFIYLEPLLKRTALLALLIAAPPAQEEPPQ